MEEFPSGQKCLPPLLHSNTATRKKGNQSASVYLLLPSIERKEEQKEEEEEEEQVENNLQLKVVRPKRNNLYFTFSYSAFSTIPR